LGSPPNVASVLAAEAMSITTWLIATPASDEFHTVKVAGRSAPQQGKRYPHNYPPQHERKNQTGPGSFRITFQEVINIPRS
jgi:hypothetical protein